MQPISNLRGACATEACLRATRQPQLASGVRQHDHSSMTAASPIATSIRNITRRDVASIRNLTDMMNSLRGAKTPRQMSVADQQRGDTRAHAWQSLSSKDIAMMQNWLARPEFPELVAAADLKERVPQPKTAMCDAMYDQQHCCYRADLGKRMRLMNDWSKPRLPQHHPVLYLYSGVDC